MTGQEKNKNGDVKAKAEWMTPELTKLGGIESVQTKVPYNPNSDGGYYPASHKS